MMQVIAVENSLDPDQTRQKVFPLKLKLSRSSGSNDGINGKVLKYDWHFFMEFSQTLNQVNCLSAQTKMKITKGLLIKI